MIELGWDENIKADVEHLYKFRVQDFHHGCRSLHWNELTTRSL